MARSRDPFIIKVRGGDIADRDVKGFSWRVYEGTSLGEPGLASLRRVISQQVPLVLGLSLALALLLLAGRLIYLQGVQGWYWRGVAEGNRIRQEMLPAQRGQISDRYGELLASNVASWRLVAIPADLPTEESERQEILSNLLSEVPTDLLDQDNLTKITARSYLPLVIAEHLPRELALKLMVLSSSTRGWRVEQVPERQYSGGEAVAHVLGYTGKLSPQQYRTARGRYQLNDTVGKAGLELQYEDLLRGVPGWREVEVDASGKERKVYSSQASLPGSSLTLTIDAGLQQTAFKSLQRAVKNSTGNRYGGSVVVLDARSAEVLALVSYPSFDPNYFTVQRDTGKVKGLLADEKKPLFNRALAGEYSPGSTIKPFIGAAALQEGLITPQTTVTSTGGVKAGNQFFADWKAGGHGLVNIYRAIAESVNTFFYIIGGGTDDRRGLGITTLVRYFTKFGFGSATGLDLSGEALGFVPTPLWKQATENDRWYRGDTYNVSIGQGKLVVTPLQLAAAYVSLVNQGELLWPHLVREVGYPSGAKSPVASRQLANVGISDEVRAVIKSAMRQTVLSGSARSLGDLPVAGKTGTAQTGSKTATHAWFAGYMPADKPAIVVVVMVEHGGEGSSVAVPVARDIFSWYLQNHRSALGL